MNVKSCTIEVLGVTTAHDGGLIAGYITAQGRGTEQDTSGFVFIGCSIFGTGKAYLGRAYRGYSRVIFYGTHMDDVIVPQGWDAWEYQGQVNEITYAEVSCDGPGADKTGRVTWEKNLSDQEVSYFTNPESFLDQDGWIGTLPPHPCTVAPNFNSDENSFG